MGYARMSGRDDIVGFQSPTPRSQRRNEVGLVSLSGLRASPAASWPPIFPLLDLEGALNVVDESMSRHGRLKAGAGESCFKCSEMEMEPKWPNCMITRVNTRERILRRTNGEEYTHAFLTSEDDFESPCNCNKHPHPSV